MIMRVRGVLTPFLTIVVAVFFSSGAAAQSVAPEVIRLGATLPLSGDIAPYGNLIKDGIELALSDLAERGLRATVAYQDVPLPGPVAVSAVDKLITGDHIQGLAGNFWNPAIPIMAPALLRNKIVSFHTAAADDLILNAGDYIFSTNTKIRDEARTIAEYVFNDLGSRSACVLYIGTNFGENYFKHFLVHFESLGGKVPYSDLTKLGETDLRGVLTKVRTSSCDTFFAAYFGTNLGMVLKQAKSLGLQKPTLSVYEAEDPSVIEVGADAAEGLRFFVPEPITDTPAIIGYKERFTKRFGYEPRILGSNGYDATTILVTTLSECKGDAECAKKRIYATREYPGVSGTFSIDADGAARKAFVLKTVRNGRFQVLDRHAAKTADPRYDQADVR